MAGCVVAIDLGGTFTDIALADLDAGQLWTTRTPTTPHDQSQGFATGVAKVLQQAGKTPGDVVAILHGSTVATNMIIERKGSPLALLTTTGCRYGDQNISYGGGQGSLIDDERGVLQGGSDYRKDGCAIGY